MNGFHLVVVGAGNIGSHLIAHLGRLAGIARVTIIDRDAYEAANLSGQDILPSDAGQAKVTVQARRLRRINPSLAVAPIRADVEELPPGLLCGDAILAGVDNRRARQHINDVAWQLGVPWIDAAVDGPGLLARVGVYVPGADAPCLECGWGDQDYAALEQAYPCERGAQRPAEGAAADRPAVAAGMADRPAVAAGMAEGMGAATGAATRAPSALGAIAGALLLLECREVLDPAARAAAGGRQIFFDLRHHQYTCAFVRRNPHCRRSPHEAWSPAPLRLDPRRARAADLLEGALSWLPAELAARGPRELRVNNLRWVRQVVCCRCGTVRAALHVLRRSLLEIGRTCPRCGGRMQARGLEVAAALSTGMLSAGQKRRTLHALGIRSGDIITLVHADGARWRGRITCDRP